MKKHNSDPNLVVLNNSRHYREVHDQVFARLASYRVIFINEEITKDLASAVSGFLIAYDKQSSKEDIFMYINTIGGDSAALMNIYDVMQMIKAPIKTICVGKAYSAGAFILAAGTKGKRLITKNAKVMIHSAQFAFPLFSKEESEDYFNFVEESNQAVLEILVRHSNQTLAKVIKDCERDLYLDAKEALKYGIVDRII